MFSDMLFTLSANSYWFYLHYDKIAGISAIILRIANSDNYLHLSIVVHYKTVVMWNLKMDKKVY